MSTLSRRFAGFIGLDDYTIGEVVTIKGKQYRFPSWTDVYDASCGSLANYQVKDEIPTPQT